MKKNGDFLFDFIWILKVLESCKTVPQTDSCDNLFDNWIKKWSNYINEDRKFFYRKKYNNRKWLQVSKIEKKLL